MSNPNNDQSTQQPGLISGHAQYIKGTVETAIGNVTGSQAWTGSGEQDKAAGVAEMKAAAEHRDPSDGYGKAEELAGKLTGCDGMKDEGAASKKSS